MAINFLGKFLANKDNNIRYVGLTTLSKVPPPSTPNSTSYPPPLSSYSPPLLRSSLHSFPSLPAPS